MPQAAWLEALRCARGGLQGKLALAYLEANAPANLGKGLVLEPVLGEQGSFMLTCASYKSERV